MISICQGHSTTEYTKAFDPKDHNGPEAESKSQSSLDCRSFIVMAFSWRLHVVPGILATSLETKRGVAGSVVLRRAREPQMISIMRFIDKD